MTDYDLHLQELAKKDWAKFVKLVGEDAIISAKVCLMRESKKSYGQIKITLGLTKSMIETRCKTCND